MFTCVYVGLCIAVAQFTYIDRWTSDPPPPSELSRSLHIQINTWNIVIQANLTVL